MTAVRIIQERQLKPGLQIGRTAREAAGNREPSDREATQPLRWEARRSVR